MVASLFPFSGILASTRDVAPATVCGHRSGFVGNQDQWLFFFAAMLFFVPVGSRHGCNVFGRGSLGWRVEFADSLVFQHIMITR